MESTLTPEISVTGPRGPDVEEIAAIFKMVERKSQSLYFEGNELGSLLTRIRKEWNSAAASKQGVNTGIKMHPFDRRQVASLQLLCEHHASCIFTKTNSTVGLGFLTDDERASREARDRGDLEAPRISGSWKPTHVDEVLDPLCDHSWLDVMTCMGEDLWTHGEGYIEIVRAAGRAYGFGPITGIHHIPATDVYLVVEDDNYNSHYEIIGSEGVAYNRQFAIFGDASAFAERQSRLTTGTFTIDRGDGTISEVIQFRRPTSLSRWYGFPDWIAAVAAIELIQCLRQWKYDFFRNRGVPEFFLWVLGQKLDDKSWKQITDAMEANVGSGKSHKSAAINIANKDIEIQIDKLGVDGKADEGLDTINETYQLAVVSAHGVPPLLAGIQIPGKLGATNELPNAIKALQALRVGPMQRIVEQRLRNTLGNRTLNGGLDLRPEEFTFRRITDEIDMAAMETSTQMRQSEAVAGEQGRKLKDGLKK